MGYLSHDHFFQFPSLRPGVLCFSCFHLLIHRITIPLKHCSQYVHSFARPNQPGSTESRFNQGQTRDLQVVTSPCPVTVDTNPYYIDVNSKSSRRKRREEKKSKA